MYCDESIYSRSWSLLLPLSFRFRTNNCRRDPHIYHNFSLSGLSPWFARCIIINCIKIICFVVTHLLPGRSHGSSTSASPSRSSPDSENRLIASSESAIIFIASIKEYRYVRWNDNKANGKFTTNLPPSARKERKGNVQKSKPRSLEWIKFFVIRNLVDNLSRCTIRKMKHLITTYQWVDGLLQLQIWHGSSRARNETMKNPTTEVEPKKRVSSVRSLECSLIEI